VQGHPDAEKENIDPFLKPPLLMITPDVSDGKSFCGLTCLCMDMLAENGNALETIVGDGPPVQYGILFLFLFLLFYFHFIK
jgi:hypothetical protein